MKAILTKVLPCTNTKPTRIKAYTEGGNSITISWEEAEYPEKSHAQTHLYVAQQLCKKLKWEGKLIGGGTPEGYAFVFQESWIREK